jgi:hypothetical protein
MLFLYINYSDCKRIRKYDFGDVLPRSTVSNGTTLAIPDEVQVVRRKPLPGPGGSGGKIFTFQYFISIQCPRIDIELIQGITLELRPSYPKYP